MTPTVQKPRLTSTVQYALCGALFGICFPAAATLLDLWVQGVSLTLHGILRVQAAQPLHWIIDTAPLFLGLMAGLAGRRQDQVARANAGLERQVAERTAEIGLLKALGADSREILWIFLTETLLIVMAGAVLGLALGFAVVRALVLFQPGLPASPPAWAVAAVFATALVAGAVFGIIPARRATRLDPVAALSRS